MQSWLDRTSPNQVADGLWVNHPETFRSLLTIGQSSLFCPVLTIEAQSTSKKCPGLQLTTHNTHHCYSVKYSAACIPAQLLLMFDKLVPLNPTDRNGPVVNNTAYRRMALPQQDE